MPKTDRHLNNRPAAAWTLPCRIVFLALALLALTAGANAKVTLEVGVYENKPLIFTGDDGRVAGLFPDILEPIAKKQGWDIAYRRAPWDQLLHMVRQGEIDLLPAIAYSTERAEWLSFSDETIMVNWAEVYSSRQKKNLLTARP